MLLDQIDWEDLEYHLETREEDDPEAILHELAHVVDALGAKRAFLGGFGNQNKVHQIITSTFSTPKELEATEMRATAITVQVLDILAPEMSHFESGYNAMLSNLPKGATATKRHQALTQCLTSPAVQSSVKAILLFLEDFLHEDEDE
jgi:hypothetical protein